MSANARSAGEQAAKVFALIERAANAGAACPSNADIAEVLGVASVGAASDTVSRLQKRGLITVQRFSAGRVVTIVATGRSTAPVAGKPHWSERGVVRQTARTRASIDAPAPPSAFNGGLPDSRIVDRDPCPKCGTRRDIGCRHTRSPEQERILQEHRRMCGLGA